MKKTSLKRPFSPRINVEKYLKCVYDLKCPDFPVSEVNFILNVMIVSNIRNSVA